MIDQADKQVSISWQCHLLGIHHSAYYHKSKGISQADLRIMELMDRMYAEDPTRGTRRYRRDLKLVDYSYQPGESTPVDEDHANQDDLLQATYHGNRPGRLQVSVFVAGAGYYPSEPSMADRYQLCSHGWWIYVSGGQY